MYGGNIHIGVTYSCPYFTAICRLSDLAGKCESQHHLQQHKYHSC